MPNIEIELNPVDFVTVGTVGPKGQRIFYLQAAEGARLVSMVIEKEQSWALSEALRELIDDLDQRYSATSELDLSRLDLDLREPIEPVFRVAQMGLGYDEERDRIILVAQELIPTQEGEELDLELNRPGVVRLWCSRDQMRALSLRAMETVKSGRPDPKQNGRLVYYWT
ncbi:MAG: DUF3090 family protein [Anaerolineae bacterium]|jgi:uncharacterized repeat protein (TIGR03847 family)|nr:DUF3090 family protein [Anaerolineae bacterium]